MKSLSKLILCLSLIAFLSSCSDEDIITDNVDTEKLEEYGGDHSGENAPLLDKNEVESQLSLIDKSQSISKDVEESIGSFTNSVKNSNKSRFITNISCDEHVYGTTIHETNTVSTYAGADKVYKLNLNSNRDVSLKLYRHHSDLDLFLYHVVKDSYGRELIGDLVEKSVNYDNNEENINVSLSEGEYFIVVETYSAESDFVLTVDCSRVPAPPHTPTWCEDFNNLRASYTYGISDQSNLWNKYSSRSRDGLVLNETAYNRNKVVKFDARRFGNQDAVRDIIGLPIRQGAYEVSFDLWIGNDSRFDFLTEKTSNYGQEQGFYAYVDNNTLYLKYRNRTYTLQSYIPEAQWINVHLYFDLDNNYVVLNMQDITIIMDSRAAHNKYYLSNNKLHGIDFFNKKYNSKFHIDEFCVTEWVPAYDDPTRIETLVYGETLDLRD